MSIEVSKKGRHRFSTNCTQCGAEFSYELSDLVAKTMYGGGTISCPCCGTVISHRPQTGKRKWL